MAKHRLTLEVNIVLSHPGNFSRPDLLKKKMAQNSVLERPFFAPMTTERSKMKKMLAPKVKFVMLSSLMMNPQVPGTRGHLSE